MDYKPSRGFKLALLTITAIVLTVVVGIFGILVWVSGGVSFENIKIASFDKNTFEAGEQLEIKYFISGIHNNWNSGTVILQLLQNGQVLGTLHPSSDLPGSRYEDRFAWKIGEYYPSPESSPKQATGDNFKIRIISKIEMGFGDSEDTQTFSIR